MLARFSTVAGELGAADAERDVRGFAHPGNLDSGHPFRGARNFLLELQSKKRMAPAVSPPENGDLRGARWIGQDVPWRRSR